MSVPVEHAFRLRRVTGWEVKAIARTGRGRMIWRRLCTLECGHTVKGDLPSTPLPRRRRCRECGTVPPA